MSKAYDALNDLLGRHHESFFDPMTTVAAIDRLVHHAIILEMTGPSFRNEHAKERQQHDTHRNKENQNRSLSTENPIDIGDQTNDVKK